MKSLEELYDEVKSNEEMKKEFVASFKEGNVESFLKSHDCDATVSDVMGFLKNSKEEAASEDDLAKVAGGWCSSATCIDTGDCHTLDVQGFGYCHNDALVKDRRK